MRFGRTLETVVYPPWRDHYIDYKKLKKLLREDESQEEREWTEKDEEAFVQEITNSLAKVDNFHAETIKQLRNRVVQCESKLEPIAAAGTKVKQTDDVKTTLEDALKELDGISSQIEHLKKYSRINFTGFLKAAKKHDRRRGSKYRIQPFLQVQLSNSSFHTEDCSSLLQRLSAMYTFSHQALQSDDKTRTDSVNTTKSREAYTAHKFWVHSENIIEIKTSILRRLPLLVYQPQPSLKEVDSAQKDPSITSTYFDNPNFKLYAQKVDKAPEASSLRLRWTGQLDDKPVIQLEKKTVSEEHGSREIRVQIKDKHIVPFLQGKFKLEKDIQKLEERHGNDSEAVNVLKKNIEEIQGFVKENGLEPMLRANYTRTAFQIPGDDRIRISLDTNIAFIREDALDLQRPCRDPEDWHRTDIDSNHLEYPFSSVKKGEVSRFPHAILEIKVRDTKATRNNSWLADLMSSHLVKEAPGFSKFVHGVAQLFEDQVNTFPFWLSDLDTDIRRDPEAAFQEEQQRQAQKIEDGMAVGSFLPGSKLSSSPGLRPKIGSPQKFSPDVKPALSQSYLSRRSQLEPTVEENAESDEDGTRAKPSSSGAASTSKGLRALFPSFSNSRYGRRHRQGKGWEDATLPPGVKDPGTWIKDSGPVKVEAKVWLANQRTFVKWQHITVLLASLSLGLYNAAGLTNNLARTLALVYTGFAVFAGVWGWGVYMWRSKLIMERSGKDFDNMIGPVAVSIGLALALCLNFAFRYSARVSAV